MREVVAAVQAALAVEDPWRGFECHITHLCQLQADNRALANLLTMVFPASPELQSLQQDALSGLTALVDRAIASGDLREDFRPEDVVLILMANAGLLERTVDAVPLGWRRHLHFVLEGLRHEPESTAPRSVGATRMRRAMRQLAVRRGLD